MAERSSRRADAVRLARAQGLFNMACGLWPSLSMSSYEKVYGAKTDRFLVRTVGSLLVGVGLNQLRAAARPEGLPYAKRLGTSAALTQLRLDLINVFTGRVPPTYLIDAAAQAGWLYAWRRTAEPPPARTGTKIATQLGVALAGAAIGGGAAWAGDALGRRAARPAGERAVTVPSPEAQPV
ncbi:hypothetical protein [Nonomuraea sp. C10]|uniref:hypothetical protein n=1 Tax=Nonomuraea sp. C10 TaxID=2600577 RepID=UPI00164F90A1|nr:hypothetical protein [Nonomuraea sp. C10]